MSMVAKGANRYRFHELLVELQYEPFVNLLFRLQYELFVEL